MFSHSLSKALQQGQGDRAGYLPAANLYPLYSMKNKRQGNEPAWCYRSCSTTAVLRDCTFLNSSGDSSAAKPVTSFVTSQMLLPVSLVDDVHLCLTGHTALKNEEKITDSDVNSEQA